MLSSDFHCKENYGTIWFPGRTLKPRTRQQWLWCSWNWGHCLWSQHVLNVRVQPRNQIIQSFSLQWKSDETTRHYLTQMLLAINWGYWEAGKIYAYVWRFNVASCWRASLKSTRFSKKQVWYFSNKPRIYVGFRHFSSNNVCLDMFSCHKWI